MPNQSCVSTFRFGESLGMLKALLQALSIPTHLISPAVWKAALKISADKKTALNLASHLFSRQFKNHNQAEAALLAVFGSFYLSTIPISDSRGGVAEI